MDRQSSEKDQNISINKAKVGRLIDYLMRLASLRAKIIRDLNEYSKVLWIHEIPKEKGCFTQAWGRNEEYDLDVWVEIQTFPEPELPQVPEICQEWVNHDSIRNTSDFPELRNTITRQTKNPAYSEGKDQPQFINKIERLDEHHVVKNAWDKYVEQKWMPWAEEHDKWEKVHRVYSKLFAIYQEQLRLGEEHELVLGIGLLRWNTPSNQQVRRHLIVANALLDFEARLGKFTIRPNPDGANLRPELDMLDIEEQPTRAEETAKVGLQGAADDPWETNCVEGILKSLAHLLSPLGEFHALLDPEKKPVSNKPLVEYAPALILRKRSVKGLTDVLKLIKERIEKQGEIPPEFADLAEITINDNRESEDDQESSTDQPVSNIGSFSFGVGKIEHKNLPRRTRSS